MPDKSCPGSCVTSADVHWLPVCAGNQAWPIGVTSIGIHERSSREKISHVMNTGGAAHIMNDEATRKYLQAMKRLLTVMQRLYPTDPSRCMDFDGYKSAERGAAGGGSDKLVRRLPAQFTLRQNAVNHHVRRSF